MAENLLSLGGRIAVVTGAAHGIGAAIATLYAANDARVVVADIDDDRGAATAAEIGGVYKHCDISSEDEVRTLVAEVEDEVGPIDILVNNAGYTGNRPGQRVTIDQFPIEHWREKVSIDFHGTFYFNRLVTERMVPRGRGCIINIASVAGVVALRNQIAHDATKAGIIKMTEAIAIELGPKGIRANTVSPGSTATLATAKIFYNPDGTTTEQGKELLSFVPLGRAGKPEDIAGAALYLASDLASYVTGQNISVDGGWTAGFNRNF